MLGYLLDPAIQVQNENGVTIAGAHVYVYDSNTSELAETYKDFNGTRNTNPVITDTLGNCTIIAEDGIAYDVVFKDDHDNILFTKENVSVNQGSSSSGNVQVVAGYGIDVTPSTSAGVQKYEVAIDPTIVETFDNMTQYEAGDNIVITDLSGNRKAISLNDDVYFSDAGNQSLLNSDEILFYDDLNQVGAGLNPYGLIVTNNYDTVFTKVEKDQIEIVDVNTPTVDKRLTERNNLLQIDYADYANSAYKTLSATPDDVTIWRHRGDGPAEYSLTGACTSAQSALAAVMSGDLTPYSAGANIDITNHVVSGKDWTSSINSATSGKLNTSTFNSYTAAHANDDVTSYSGGTGISVSNHKISCTGDITSYSAGTGISVSNHKISCTGDITPYTQGANIKITNHVVSGRDWTSNINNAATNNNWDVTPYSGGTGISVSNHQISCLFAAPVYLETNNFPYYYTFVALDGQNGLPSWLNVPNTQYQDGIVKDNNKNCYSLVDQSSSKMCEVDADFVIKIDALPADSSTIDIAYGVASEKVSSPSCRNAVFYATGIYYIHLHRIIYGKEFYFFGSNRSYLVGGGTASIYLQNVSIRSI